MADLQIAGVPVIADPSSERNEWMIFFCPFFRSKPKNTVMEHPSEMYSWNEIGPEPPELWCPTGCQEQPF